MSSLLDRIRALIPSPSLSEYDTLEYRKKTWPEMAKRAAQDWALQGYGAPFSLYLLYSFKILFYIAAWVFFCSFPAGWEGAEPLIDKLMSPVAFQKAVLWSMLFEILGFGCGSGPLAGRYLPPFGGFLHFLRVGCIKLPLFPGILGAGGNKRTLVDVLLYTGFVLSIIRALISSELSMELHLPVVMLLPLMAFRDKTLFLAARGEHYYALLICFLFSDDWIAGAMAVQLAIWIWAAISKLTPHFPSVTCVMLSNSPVVRSKWFRKKLYRSFPDDLSPSGLARGMAHFGTAVEFLFPILLIFGAGEAAGSAGLVLMLVFHCWITAHFPAGVPIEWNFMVVYSALFLFGMHPEISFWNIGSPLLCLYLFLNMVLLPLIGNLKPNLVSFLLSMRYYAGNWAYNIWLFRKGAMDKFEKHIQKSSTLPQTQLRKFYTEDMVEGLMQKVMAFRAMHLHGKLLPDLYKRAVSKQEEYEYMDGELIAGVSLGWNFGDGHLSDDRLLKAVQAECNFGPGELRVISVEAQPLAASFMEWKISDACEGLVDKGTASEIATTPVIRSD